jgi:hypothetical protein
MPGRARIQPSLLFFAAIALASCGGGGSKLVSSTPGTIPIITAQPVSQSVTVGQSASFFVTAAGTAPLTYQWQQNNSNIAGATSSSYTTPSTTSTDDGKVFAVVVSNSAGSITSGPAKLSVSATAPASNTDVVTFHNDVARTGLNSTETLLTPGNVNVHSFGLLRNLAVDGRVDAQPLFLSALMINGTAHDVVFVETEHDSVYAIDSDTGAVLWQDGVANLAPPDETSSDNRGCSQTGTEIGITATPVIDRKAGPHGTMFLVTMSLDIQGMHHQRLHALDITTGAEMLNGPTEIQATYPGSGTANTGGTMVFLPSSYKERAALLLTNGNIYMGFGSHCDVPPYSAWVMAYSESTLQQTSVINLTPNGQDTGVNGRYGSGAIWQSGGGPAADTQGNVYIAIANGDFETTLDTNGFPNQQDFGNAFVKLSLSNGKLSVADYFAMSNTLAESDGDTDLGSGGPLVLPDLKDANGKTQQLTIVAGKDGHIYVVDRGNMGKFNAMRNAIYQDMPGAVPQGVWGVPAYFNETIYYCDSNNPMKAFSIGNATLTGPLSSTTVSFGYPGAIPAVSANGTSDAIVWAIENANPAVLHAYAANDLTNELYNSNQASGNQDNPGLGNKFITPVIANGKVFVATQNSVAVFGLLITPR